MMNTKLYNSHDMNTGENTGKGVLHTQSPPRKLLWKEEERFRRDEGKEKFSRSNGPHFLFPFSVLGATNDAVYTGAKVNLFVLP